MLDLDWPILQVVTPLFGAIFAAISLRALYARYIAIFASIISLGISLYGFLHLNGTKRYLLGGFSPPFGIEYRLDDLSQPIIVYIFTILLFVLIFCRKSIIYELEESVESPSRHIIYVMMLLIATGLAGMVATNDLFNLYVFLEIASLSSYALISQGRDDRAASGGLDYLILGTIGASLILMGIGLLYSSSGTLNIDDLHIRLGGLYHSRMIILGLAFFITGVLLKVALFPLHLWMIKAYRFAASSSLVYIAGLSSVVGFYVLVRFIYFTLDYHILYEQLYFGAIMRFLSIAAIIISSYLALKADTARSILVYSIAAQVGYICLMLITPSPAALGVLASCILADSLLKMGLFASLSSAPTSYAIEEGQCSARWNKMQSFLLLFNLLSSAGMPLTIGFINKINIISVLFSRQDYVSLFVVVASSILALEYHYRLYRVAKIGSSMMLGISSFASIILLVMNLEVVGWFARFFEGGMSG